MGRLIAGYQDYSNDPLGVAHPAPDQEPQHATSRHSLCWSYVSDYYHESEW